VTTSWGHTDVTAQLRSNTMASVATDLLTWANTLSAATVEAWRPPERDRLHLFLRATLPSPAGVIELKVFVGMDYDPRSWACPGGSIRWLHVDRTSGAEREHSGKAFPGGLARLLVVLTRYVDPPPSVCQLCVRRWHRH
jgi:hypothetical protein